MLKSFFLAGILIFALTLLGAKPTFSSPLNPGNLFIAETTLNSPLPQGSDSKDAAKANANVPNCNAKTAGGTQSNLESSCEEASKEVTPRATYTQPPHPYDTEAIKKFNEDLYGAGN